ncbi:hypothetical protein [Nocardia sp. BMG111209]|uniref:hypothetical protein n=1 Tax=Nocardia sp. BMG111209 TaxID=1160137 RepID=UPI00037B3DFF|nr:hypothetical protein [Nocardia sp. BMG111209]
MTDRLHRATHRIPGVPAHVDRGPGHQGTVRHETRLPGERRRHAEGRWNHSPARPPRVLAGWQARIAAFFGREL